MNPVFVTLLSISVLLQLQYVGSVGDLVSDGEALLDFAASVPHGRKVNWSSDHPVCVSWVGITCDPNLDRVVELRLPAVGLHGPIPAWTIGRLDALTVLSLRSNRLTGDIPADLLAIPSLHYLFLQHNNLSGRIPGFVSPNISVFDLSFNLLTGRIPENFPTRVRRLDLSHNRLTGPIPASLSAFPSSCFAGNLDLCGTPLKPCATGPSPLPRVPKKEPSRKKISALGITAVAIGGSVFLFLLMLALVLCSSKKRERRSGGTTKGKQVVGGGRGEKGKEDFGSGVRDSEKNKLVFFEGCNYNFDLEDLLRASAEVLGKGSHGTTYKALLEDCTTVVVKRLKEVVVGKKEFEQQMETIGRSGHHPNVVPLRAYYYSKDEKLLVSPHIPAGSLSALLHGDRERGPLEWGRRLRIALGAARGIAHIHTGGDGRLVHGNIKSSNILLTGELEARVSDFGLSQVMAAPAGPTRGAGYRAPEVGESRRPTQRSDVYSFGVLLLEMLTGKAPTQSPGRDDVADLPRWVQSVVREEWTAEVFDVELMKPGPPEDELVQMLQIGMGCVTKAPDMRPDMHQVVRMIEEIRPSDSDNPPSSSSIGSKALTP